MCPFCVWLFSASIFASQSAFFLQNPVGAENTQFSSLFFPVYFDVGILDCFFS